MTLTESDIARARRHYADPKGVPLAVLVAESGLSKPTISRRNRRALALGLVSRPESAPTLELTPSPKPRQKHKPKPKRKPSPTPATDAPTEPAERQIDPWQAPPSQPTREVIEAICARISEGVTIQDAAWSCGVPWETLERWLIRGGVDHRAEGERATCAHAGAYRAIMQAQALARATICETMSRAASRGEWRAAYELGKLRGGRDWSDAVAEISEGETEAQEVVDMLRQVRDR